jgi:hypothetical protein
MYQTRNHPYAPYAYGGGCSPCPCGTPMLSPYELSVTSGGAAGQAFVGGAQPARLSLEYVVDDGAASPTIKVTTASAGSSSTWEETSPATGYQVKSDFLTVDPGTKVTLDVSETTARLRWCELFCC